MRHRLAVDESEDCSSKNRGLSQRTPIHKTIFCKTVWLNVNHFWRPSHYIRLLPLWYLQKCNGIPRFIKRYAQCPLPDFVKLITDCGWCVCHHPWNWDTSAFPHNVCLLVYNDSKNKIIIMLEPRRLITLWASTTSHRNRLQLYR
jgi:hypothetical protein